MRDLHGDGWAILAVLGGGALAVSVTVGLSASPADVAPAEAVVGEAPVAVQARAFPEPERAPLAAEPIPPVHAGVAFQASSLASGELVEGDYGGRLTHEGEAFVLRVPLARIETMPWDPSRPTVLRGVRLVLMEYGPEGPRVVRSGKLLRVDEVLSPGQALWLEDLVLELRGVPESELHWERWLALEQEYLVRTPTGSLVERTRIEAPRDLFARLFGWRDSC